MHHHKTYMYVNFQQNRVGRSVKTVYTILFTKNGKLLNLQLPIEITKKFNYLRHASS